MERRITRRELIKKGALAGAVLKGGVFLAASRALAASIDPATVRNFGSSLKGYLILPGDKDYESARRIWDWSIDRHPTMIVRCADAIDVQKAIEFARAREMVMAVRSGGHGYWSTCEKGMVIDLSQMKGIDVDQTHLTARAQMGVRVTELDHAAQRFGLAAAVGQCSTVGLGGLTLGGGEGNLIAKYGMTCDNVRSAEVVLADGRIVQAGEPNQDLLWGVCGGGGNFGAVTTIEYELHPVHDVVAGTFEYPANDISDVLHFYNDFAAKAPDELSATLKLHSSRGGEHLLKILWCWCGAPAEGERVLAPFRSRFKGVRDRVHRMTYLEAQAAGDYRFEPRTSIYSKSRFIDKLSDEIIETLSGDLPPQGASWFMIHYHGEVTRRPSTFNAFPLREPGYNPAFQASWQGSERNDSGVKWVDRMFAATARSSKGVYVNYLGDEGDARMRAAYGSNFHRLVQLKNTYDPTNFFCMNQNIKPSV